MLMNELYCFLINRTTDDVTGRKILCRRLAGSREAWTQRRQRGALRKPVDDIACAKELERRARIGNEHPEWAGTRIPSFNHSTEVTDRRNGAPARAPR